MPVIFATMVQYWDRLKPEMDAKGLDITKFSDAMGVTFQAVAKVRDGGSFGSTNNIKAAALLGVNSEWLATGKGSKKPSDFFSSAKLLWPDREEEMPRDSSDDVLGELAFPELMRKRKPGEEEINFSNNPEYPAIRRVRFALSAGASGFGVDYEGEDRAPIVFGRYWYETRGLTPSKLFAVRVANGSMEPGMKDGDTVVVNTGAIEPKDGVCFAVNYEGELVIKRLLRDEGAWWLSSDNSDQRRYPRKRMTDDCFVIGQIIHKQSEHI
jgi:phage repressor protein C with HTH and peptisase S24 domain